MKSAEEWINEMSTLDHSLLCACSQCRNGRERFITPDNIKQIQLDAWKRGMSEAANIATQREVHGGVSETDDLRDFDKSASLIRKRILTARDNKKEIMKTYRIEYTRNDKAELEWREWAFGYPFKNAEQEVKRLNENNKDFDFRLKEDNRS